MMKKLCFMFFALMTTVILCAQEQQRFSPEKFDAELQEFITNEAKLTPQEAAKFFPIYKEMQAKQRALFERQRQLVSQCPQDENACKKAIRERDEIDLEMKHIQQTYHERFLEILPASKVYEILKAEDKFHRQMFRRYNRNKSQPNHRQRPPQKLKN